MPYPISSDNSDFQILANKIDNDRKERLVQSYFRGQYLSFTPEEVIDEYVEKLLKYYKNSQKSVYPSLIINVDPFQNQIQSLIYYQKDGVTHTYVPVGKLDAWINVGLHRVFITRCRRKKSKISFDEIEYKCVDFKSSAAYRLELMYLNDFLEKLDSKTKKIIILHYIQGYEYKEIVEILVGEGLEPVDADREKLCANVRQNSCRGIKKLRELFSALSRDTCKIVPHLPLTSTLTVFQVL